jgi:putative metalloprotease
MIKKLSLSAIALLLVACNATQGPTVAGNAPASKTTGNAPAGGGLLGSLGALAGAATSGGTGSSSSDNKVGAGLDLLKAATISDVELKAVSLQMRARDDKMNRVAAGDKYAARLAKLTAKHVNEDGMKLNFKVYRSDSINANASADGSVRLYSAMMDKMTDQELLGIIGHEIGHVKYGHSLASLRTAYMASAGRKAAASASGVAGALADSDLGAIGEKLLNSQFSQSQETESDDYGLAFMKKYGYDAHAMETAFRKLAALGGSQTGLDQMMSSHPDSAKRADRMRDKLAQK